VTKINKCKRHYCVGACMVRWGLVGPSVGCRLGGANVLHFFIAFVRLTNNKTIFNRNSAARQVRFEFGLGGPPLFDFSRSRCFPPTIHCGLSICVLVLQTTVITSNASARRHRRTGAG
jgi:hypothetical protein